MADDNPFTRPRTISTPPDPNAVSGGTAAATRAMEALVKQQLGELLFAVLALRAQLAAQVPPPASDHGPKPSA